MRFIAYRQVTLRSLAASAADGPFHGLPLTDPNCTGTLSSLVAQGGDRLAEAARAPARFRDRPRCGGVPATPA